MISFDLIIEHPGWEAAGPLRPLCAAAFSAAAEVAPTEGVVALLLTDNGALAELNRQYRGKDGPTDVLSFPAAPEQRPFLGDIAMAFELARDDAAAQGKALHDHVAHLLIHAYLHLLGHDHKHPEEAARMEALEIRALAHLGIADPYTVD